MPKPTRQQNRLEKAKQIFFLNLGLCGVLSVFIWFIFSGDEIEKISTSQTPVDTPVVLTLQESANLKGQILALSEHPGSMPPYEKQWVAELAQKQIERDPAFDGVLTSEKSELIEEFFKGYTARFDDYYDGKLANTLGYQFGLNFDPSQIENAFRPSIHSYLQQHKEVIVKKYAVTDPAAWHLFCKHFKRGFDVGFFIVDESVPIRSLTDNIKFFDD